MVSKYLESRKVCCICGIGLPKWNLDFTRDSVCGRCTIGATNLIAYLENRYKEKVSTSVDFSVLKERWIKEGRPGLKRMVDGTKKKLDPEADPEKNWPALWKCWDRKKNPLTWDDTNEKLQTSKA